MICQVRKLSCLLIILTLCACGQRSVRISGDRVPLDTGWTLACDGISVEATVPSTVAGSLYDAGFFGEDLLEGRNYEKVDKSIFDGVWSYTTAFAGKPVKGQH